MCILEAHPMFLVQTRFLPRFLFRRPLLHRRHPLSIPTAAAAAAVVAAVAVAAVNAGRMPETSMGVCIC